MDMRKIAKLKTSFDYDDVYLSINRESGTEPSKAKKFIDEDEALEIFNEIIEVLKEHNLSYGCAYQVALSFAYAMTSGAVELYENSKTEDLE